MMHDWEVISADESMMQRLARYMRRLVKEKEADPTLMTEEASQLKTSDTISPLLAQQIKQAREEYANGETITCNNPQEMLQYFDSL